MLSIDHYSYYSRFRYIHAGEKMTFSILPLLLCIGTKSVCVAILVMACMGILTLWGGVPFFRYLRFLMLPFSFLALSTFALVIQIRQMPLDLFAIQLGSIYFTTSIDSIYYATSLILIALASVSCLYFLGLSTPLPGILEVLRFLHCPLILSEIMLLMYRFIFVLLADARQIGIAQKCRLGNKDYKTAYTSFGILGAFLFVRSILRARHVYTSMEVRGYDGEIQVLSEQRPVHKGRMCIIGIFVCMLAVLAWMTRG